MEFSVCFTGEFRSDFNKKSVEKDFSKLFNLNDEDVLKRIFSESSPILIRKNLTLLKAERYRKELHNIGMQTIIIDKENTPLQKFIQVEAIETTATDNTDSNTPSSIVFNKNSENDDQIYAEPSIETCTTNASLSWLSTAFEQFKKAPKFWTSITLLWGVALAIFQIIPIVGSIIAIIFSGIISAFLTLAAHRLSNNQEISFSIVMDNFKPSLKQIAILSVLAGIFYSTLFSIILSIFGDNLIISIVILIVGTSALSMAFLFSPILILVKRTPIPEALKLSFEGCRQNILPLSVYSLLATSLIIVGMIPLGLGILIAIPLLILTTYQAYNEIIVY
ncbi:MAG: hypothetical protein KAG53_08790 [Endozoicomonadaceae bacterium]|nr:hypothetical protein [Endozoicomonadaceae bacterium]